MTADNHLTIVLLTIINILILYVRCRIDIPRVEASQCTSCYEFKNVTAAMQRKGIPYEITRNSK